MIEKIGIKKELEAKREQSNKKTENIEKDTKLLMEPDSLGEREALRKSGLDYHIKEAEKIIGASIDRDNSEKEYGNKSFTHDEIKDICIKYDLRFLNAIYFKGKIDVELSKKLKDFMDKNTVGDYDNNFFIIAPRSAFNLEGKSNKSLSQVDHILLYHLPRTGQYIYIHRWGSDFTILRRLKGVFFKSESNIISITTSAWIIFFSIILPLMFNGFTGQWYQYLNLLWITPVSLFLAWFMWSIYFNEKEYFYKKITSFLWNERDKRCGW